MATIRRKGMSQPDDLRDAFAGHDVKGVERIEAWDENKLKATIIRALGDRAVFWDVMAVIDPRSDMNTRSE
jgi:hypothetical protein